MQAHALESGDRQPTQDQQSIVVGMGCFWGAQKRMNDVPGVIATQVGYAGGTQSNPTYKDVLAAEHRPQERNHAEVVKISFQPQALEQVLIAFWQNHDPTQGNRQGNDVGSNYRSVIYYTTEEQRWAAESTKAMYQQALQGAGYGSITTEIVPLSAFYPAEDYHQDFLRKNPLGYCGLGGTGVLFPGTTAVAATEAKIKPLVGDNLNYQRQLLVFEAEGCGFCRRFQQDILAKWHAEVPIISTMATTAPSGWTLAKPILVSPTIILFKNGQETSRYTGYDGDQQRFWQWLGQQILSPEQQRIAYAAGTEMPFTGSLLDQDTPGTYVDSVTGVPLFRSEGKFHSGTGWPSFFEPVPNALIMHTDDSLGMHRVEVRSASSGIHLGHVFTDGPPPTGKRYCINSAVLRFVPDR